MPFTLSVSELANLVKTVPGISAVHDVQMPPGRGAIFNSLLSGVYRVPLLNPVRPTLTLVEFRDRI